MKRQRLFSIALVAATVILIAGPLHAQHAALEVAAAKIEVQSQRMAEQLEVLSDHKLQIASAQLDRLETLDHLEPLHALDNLVFVSPGRISISSGEVQDESAKAYQAAYNLVLDENWGEAITALNGFIKSYPRSSYQDDAAFWLCYAQEKNGMAGEAVFKCYQNFLEKHKGSKWADDAKANLIRLGHQLSKEGKTGYETYIRSLEESNDEELSLAALYALENIGDAQALESTFTIFDKTSSEKIRSKIIYIMAEFDDPRVVKKLADIAAKDPSVSVRKRAVYALGEMQEAEAQGALEHLIRTPGEQDVRKAAIHALSGRDYAGRVALLGDLGLNETDASLAKTATYALQEIEGGPF